MPPKQMKQETFASGIKRTVEEITERFTDKNKLKLP